eukprot:gnl/TRDRNA2_/TRDRNA2_41112_c0_seq1.p1 gnl/TRDRNA2_/TRDRNA2_41112_c0~~gnl/TRDRNA2_/TRDRNA2_41112_c0_seq1.p1  ORF type:complete len:270 (-),score=48.21 gnl/TRDRNA2_/TRDRNA2_41112_c0_seq1:40-849(-)
MAEGGSFGGFALEAYVVPKCGMDKKVQYGTMPKASLEAGGLFADVKSRANAAPGPEKYFKDFLEKSWTAKASGGTFGKVGRDGPKQDSKTPAVGQYDASTGIALTRPRTRGGMMSKTDRGSIFYDAAMKNSKNSPPPGKYDAVMPTKKKVAVPKFYHDQNKSRLPKSGNNLGPGVYNPNHAAIEKRPPNYASSKDPSRSFLDTLVKQKEKIPAPGHRGIPESKNVDRIGWAKHTNQILNDRASSAGVTTRCGSSVVSTPLSTPRPATTG